MEAFKLAVLFVGLLASGFAAVCFGAGRVKLGVGCAVVWLACLTVAVCGTAGVIPE